MKEQDVIFKKRLQDLARTAYYRDIATFTDFLDLNELHMVHSFRPEESGVELRYFGGYEGAERQIAAFFLMLFLMKEKRIPCRFSPSTV